MCSSHRPTEEGGYQLPDTTTYEIKAKNSCCVGEIYILTSDWLNSPKQILVIYSCISEIFKTTHLITFEFVGVCYDLWIYKGYFVLKKLALHASVIRPFSYKKIFTYYVSIKIYS